MDHHFDARMDQVLMNFPEFRESSRWNCSAVSSRQGISGHILISWPVRNIIRIGRQLKPPSLDLVLFNFTFSFRIEDEGQSTLVSNQSKRATDKEVPPFPDTFYDSTTLFFDDMVPSFSIVQDSGEKCYWSPVLDKSTTESRIGGIGFDGKGEIVIDQLQDSMALLFLKSFDRLSYLAAEGKLFRFD